MKNTILFSKIFLLLAVTFLISSCIKNDNLIEGDAKVRFFQAASTDTTQNFYFNGAQLGSSATAGTNSSYIVVPGDALYSITTKNINSNEDVASISDQKFEIGKNYSVYYTKTEIGKAPSLRVDTDDVKINPEKIKINFLNLGYTLGSKVIVSEAGAGFASFSLAYSDKKLQEFVANKDTKISFVLETPTLTNPQPRVDTLSFVVPSGSSALAISNGRVYTLLIDGTKAKELRVRLVTATN